MRHVRWVLLIATPLALGAAAQACSAEGRPGPVGDLRGAGGDEGVFGTGTGSTRGVAQFGDACAAEVRRGEVLPLDMYILLDKSASMLEATGAGPSKWEAIRSALETFVSDPGSSGLGVGLQYFPLFKPGVPSTCSTHAACGVGAPCFLSACANETAGLVPCVNDADCGATGPCVEFGVCELLETTGEPVFCAPMGSTCDRGLGRCLDISDRWCINGVQCDATSYATPDVPVATLPTGSDALLRSIRAAVPDGRTPTGPALEGAISQAAAWASTHPAHRVVAVLATDGLPTECDPLPIQDVARIANRGLSGTPSISTFVIGVFGPNDAESPLNLDRIALAGGTSSAFIVQTDGDVTASFLRALDAIRGSARLSCELQLPPNENGELDFFSVNLELTVGDVRRDQLVNVQGPAQCGAAPGLGWYYDSDPRVSAPTKIVVCPDVCGTFQSETGATVNLQIGCQTILR